MPAARPALTIQHVFSLAVAAFALVHAGFGIAGGDKALLGVAAAGLVFALAGWFSTGIPTFLRIFSGIFSVEYCLFGLPVLLQRTGVAREEWADFIPPVSLPVTVAVFGIIIWAIARIPAIRTIMRIADLFFDTRERNVARVWPLPAMQVRESRLATLAVVVLVVINQAQVAINVRLSYFSRDWFNAIQDKNEPEFWRLLIYVFFLWAVIYIASTVVEYVIQSGLTIRWRQWLTDYLTTEWLRDGSHYRMTLAGGTADNPDQRIAVDVSSFVTSTYGFSIQLLATVSSLVSFSIVLWSISAAFTLPYTDIAVPGLLFWVALVYAGLGTLFTHLIGRRLAGLNFEQQRYEADFRFSLARLREYSEQVSLLRGEPAERHLIMERFGAVIRNFWRIVNVRKALMGFTAGYGQVSSIVPYVIVAPFYFSGKIALGTMQQTAGAFARVQGALDFFVNYYVELADYKAVIDRLSTFDLAIQRARGLGRATPRIEHGASGTGDVVLDGLDLGLPDGRTIVSGAALSLPAGKATLITGPSGSGKSTLLRAIAGIWPYGRGAITVPPGASVMLLPQRPYIPIGSLRSAVSYPSVAGTYPDTAIRDALAAARLPGLSDRLDEEENWNARLSGGEQQRVALARALLAKPDWLFLDEATAALDEVTEKALYEALHAHLPATTIVSIGHRSTLLALHGHHVEMTPGASGTFTPKAVPAAEPAA